MCDFDDAHVLVWLVKTSVEQHEWIGSEHEVAERSLKLRATYKPIRVLSLDEALGYAMAGPEERSVVEETGRAFPYPPQPKADQVASEAPEFLMQFFSYDHLPQHLQLISKPFVDLARELMKLPRNPERTVALRKLLEAKDCAVRARVVKS